MSTEDILREIDARFVSANSVPVERAMVKRVEWEAIKDLLARLSMKVNAAACLHPGPVVLVEPVPRYQCFVPGCPGNHPSKHQLCSIDSTTLTRSGKHE